MVKNKTVMIDINSLNGKLCGDVCSDITEVSYRTPVLGGVGPMIIAMLLHDTVRATNAQSLHRSLYSF